MKILDKYLLKTFAATFGTVFIILFFIFVLQTVWLFINELAGKDLDFGLILKFLLFSMPRIVPLVLPLSIVLSSIMTFGSFSENYEFAAMKSAGISLQRAMRSLVFFIIGLSIVSFFFANNVIPYAEFKFVNFRRNLAQMKPALAITEGQFSEVGSYTIKVDKKLGENGNFLEGVTIHKKSPNGEGNTTVIKSKKGELVSSESSNLLKMVLTDGYYYEDIIPKEYKDINKIPFAKAQFKRDIINIDLTKLNQTDNSVISNTDAMMNVNQLRYTLDSLNKNLNKEVVSNAANNYQRSGISSQSYYDNLKIPVAIFKNNNLLVNLTKQKKIDVLSLAKSNVENVGVAIDSQVIEIVEKNKNINSHWVSLFNKFMIAFSCLLMFFIGAPLGAIIRKGGLGLPIVFAVVIFIIFHFINTFSARVAQEDGMSPFLGTWLSSLILTPLAFILTYRATKDIGGMINFDVVFEPIVTFFKRILPKKQVV